MKKSLLEREVEERDIPAGLLMADVLKDHLVQAAELGFQDFMDRATPGQVRELAYVGWCVQVARPLGAFASEMDSASQEEDIL